jgi:N-acetyl-beta-hexosaminidase
MWQKGPPPKTAVFPRYYYYKTRDGRGHSLITVTGPDHIVFLGALEWLGPLPHPDDYPLCQIRFPATIERMAGEAIAAAKINGASKDYVAGYEAAVKMLTKHARQKIEIG